MLGRRIAARQAPPTCLPELRRALLDEWCNIPQDQIDNLILSMPRRCPGPVCPCLRTSLVVWEFEERVPAQVSFSSLDQGLKL
ncbi:DDE_3 domain-containing protein [Trichonephila clavipes]|nr:DDE_3 domain-containing protein [Trichonephila clavipes]